MTTTESKFIPVPDSVDESVSYPVLAPVVFEPGFEVLYHGAKVVGAEKQLLHIVSNPAKNPEAKYMIWGTAMLNRKLEKAGAGELLYLKYHGKEPHPTLEGAQQHVWEVGRTSSAPAVAAGGTKAARPAPLTSW